MKSPSDFSAMDFSAAFDSMNPAKFLESMQQVQQAWSTMGVSAGLTPTMDLEEIDKRIANLKAVEQWLNLNLTMLQSSVQALQVQRSTIATLNNLGDSLGKQSGPLSPESIKKAMAQAGAGSTTQTPNDGKSNAATFADPMAWFDMLQQQFVSIASNTVGSPVQASSTASAKSSTKANQKAKAKPVQPAQNKTDTAAKKSGASKKRKPASKSKSGK